MDNFGERLRNLRGSCSQRELATALGMPPTTLASLEKQETPPRGEVLLRLSEYFKVPVSYFYKTPEPTPKATDAAREWLQHLRKPAQGKDTVATQATQLVDDQIKERIARALRKEHGKVSHRR